MTINKLKGEDKFSVLVLFSIINVYFLSNLLFCLFNLFIYLKCFIVYINKHLITGLWSFTEVFQWMWFTLCLKNILWTTFLLADGSWVTTLRVRHALLNNSSLFDVLLLLLCTFFPALSRSLLCFPWAQPEESPTCSTFRWKLSTLCMMARTWLPKPEQEPERLSPSPFH